MRTSRRTVLGVAVFAFAVTGCAAARPQVAAPAVREMGALVGSKRTTLELTAQDVTRLATQAGVSEEVIRDTAPHLHSQAVWGRSVTNVRRVYDQTPGPLRSNVVGLACDTARGKITSQAELSRALRDRLTGYSPLQQIQVRNDVNGLAKELTDAAHSQDPKVQASAALTCFTVEQLTG